MKASIPKRLRFEVFKRDSFKCQYCGKAAPEVVLHCDHIKPEADGGETTMLNLVTACADCNIGKGRVPLTDSAAVSKQKAQLDELQERREQLEMLFDWQQSLADSDSDAITRIAEFWASLVTGYHLNSNGLHRLRKLLIRYSPAEIMDAMRKSTATYLKLKGNSYTSESVQFAFDKVGNVCQVSRDLQTEPYLTDLFQIRAIVKNRCGLNDKWYLSETLRLLKRAHVEHGIGISELREVALRNDRITHWQDEMNDLMRAR